jgi:hypothetical protein
MAAETRQPASWVLRAASCTAAAAPTLARFFLR